MILGFTGTRKGMTPEQLATLNLEMDNPGLDIDDNSPPKLIHGGAEGADETMDSLCCFRTQEPIEVYPCTWERYQYWVNKDKFSTIINRIVHQVKPPLVRNKIIVERAALMIATPYTMEEELRSGTWATLRYARKLNKPITIIFPDGSIQREAS